MTQVCRVCSHPDRKTIDREIVSGGNLSEIGRRYGIGKDSVWRHKRDHLGGAAVAGVRRSFENHGVKLLETMLDRMNELTARTESLLDQAEEKDQVRNALLAVQQLRNNYQTMGTIITSMGQTELGMSSDELEEFQQWKESKGTIDLDLFSPEDRELIREIAIEKLAGMGSLEEVQDFRSNSFIVQEHVNVEDVEEVLERFDADPDLEYRVGNDGHSLQPMRTRPRPVEEDPAPGRTTPRNEDSPMRRTTPRQ